MSFCNNSKLIQKSQVHAAYIHNALSMYNMWQYIYKIKSFIIFVYNQKT